MVFNSLHFVAFFVVVYALYRALPHRAQNAMLLAASYYFYAAWDWRFLGLLIGSTTVDYFCGLYIARQQTVRRRRAALLVSLSFNLGALGFFKYFNFFAASLHGIFGRLGWNLDFVTVEVLLPIGISFYTFMTISYVVDVYRRDIEPCGDFLDFALFVAYFPHLVAGPILRAAMLIPQIARPRTITALQVTEGLWLIGFGYFQKVFVADNLARVVDRAFGASGNPTGLEVLLASYAFAFQILGDFAGYSNIARGVSKLMGIELNVNFLYPYFVRTPQEFWRHWHISLSTWLRDYLYIPLGGSRGSPARTYRNLLVTMVLGGLWHGAAWTFVLWGAYQGVVLVVHRLASGWLAGARAVTTRVGRLPGAVTALLMFHVTCYGWLIFRARSVDQIADFSWRVVAGFTTSADTWSTYTWPLIAYVTPFLALHAYEYLRNDLYAVARLPMAARYAVYAAMFYLILLFGDFGGTQFIYFQF
jgi:D-alanyl-lipoteichoic acid acyltransferase DltB (MBOAT superfamily)